MCLVVYSGSRKTAKHAIRIYKVVACKHNENDKWCGPYEYNEKMFPFGAVIHEKLVHEYDMAKHSVNGRPSVCVEGGFFHSVKTYDDAYRELLHIKVGKSFPTNIEYKIVKGFIPINAQYYEGAYQTHSYASNAIILQQPLKKNQE